MPCLNAAETLAVCIRKAKHFLDTAQVRGEVLIADNGSSDDSRGMVAIENARLWRGAARRDRSRARMLRNHGRCRRFLRFRESDTVPGQAARRRDLVMGNRFRGGFALGATPPLHRYLGYPVLSFLGQLFFRIGVGDFHCGLRSFGRERMLAMDLRSTGMEFASELVVRAALARYDIAEVPTTLQKDGRSRPPHLRTWSDGWPNLRFLLTFRYRTSLATALRFRSPHP